MSRAHLDQFLREVGEVDSAKYALKINEMHGRACVNAAAIDKIKEYIHKNVKRWENPIYEPNLLSDFKNEIGFEAFIVQDEKGQLRFFLNPWNSALDGEGKITQTQSFPDSHAKGNFKRGMNGYEFTPNIEEPVFVLTSLDGCSEDAYKEAKVFENLHASQPAVYPQVYYYVDKLRVTLIMPKARHGNLTHYFKNQQNSPDIFVEAFIICYSLISQLITLHSAGYIHKDVKSLNVLMMQANRPLLCDFGSTETRGTYTRSEFDQLKNDDTHGLCKLLSNFLNEYHVKYGIRFNQKQKFIFSLLIGMFSPDSGFKPASPLLLKKMNSLLVKMTEHLPVDFAKIAENIKEQGVEIPKKPKYGKESESSDEKSDGRLAILLDDDLDTLQNFDQYCAYSLKYTLNSLTNEEKVSAEDGQYIYFLLEKLKGSNICFSDIAQLRDTALIQSIIQKFEFSPKGYIQLLGELLKNKTLSEGHMAIFRAVFDRLEHCKEEPYTQFSALIDVIKSKNSLVFKLLFEKNKPLFSSHSIHHKDNLLISCIKEDAKDILRYLLEEKTLESQIGQNDIFDFAFKNNRSEILLILLDKIQTTDPERHRVLCEKYLGQLLKDNDEEEEDDDDDDRVQLNPSKKLITNIFNRIPDKNTRYGKYKRTAVHLAAITADPKIFIPLLGQGNCVDQIDDQKETVLMAVVRSESLHNLKALLDFKPNILQKNNQDQNALDIAADHCAVKVLLILLEKLEPKIVEKRCMEFVTDALARVFDYPHHFERNFELMVKLFEKLNKDQRHSFNQSLVQATNHKSLYPESREKITEFLLEQFKQIENSGIHLNADEKLALQTASVNPKILAAMLASKGNMDEKVRVPILAAMNKVRSVKGCSGTKIACFDQCIGQMAGGDFGYLTHSQAKSIFSDFVKQAIKPESWWSKSSSSSEECIKLLNETPSLKELLGLNKQTIVSYQSLPALLNPPVLSPLSSNSSSFLSSSHSKPGLSSNPLFNDGFEL